MRITCDCGNDTFYLNFLPPLRCIVECNECGETREIGGDGGHDTTGRRPTEGPYDES